MPPVNATRCMVLCSGFRHGGFLGGGDSFLYECIPFVALRALPQQLGAAIAAVRADVGVKVENRVAGQRYVPTHEIGVEMQFEQRPPDLLMNDQSMRIVGERG